MAEYKWPDADKRSLIGKRISRIDGPAKASGKAKYTFDIKRPGMLFGKMLHSPYAHAKIVSIDTSAAEKMPGGGRLSKSFKALALRFSGQAVKSLRSPLWMSQRRRRDSRDQSRVRAVAALRQ